MEFQLRRLTTRYPDFFRIAENAVKTGYQMALIQMTTDMRCDPLCSQRLGYYILTNVDHELRRAYENVCYNEIQVVAAPNVNGSSTHLEIHTPFAVIMVAKVPCDNSIPRRTYYRDKYVDQVFMPEVFPEYSLFTDDCIPLYIITHVLDRGSGTPTCIHVGRLAARQISWACNYPIGQLYVGQGEEVIKKGASPIVQEEVIEKDARVKLKKV